MIQTAPIRRGFGLSETLISVAVLAVLLALSLPGLSAIRRESGRIACLAEMREQATILQMYASSNNDKPPFFLQRHPQGGFIGHDGRRLPEQHFGIQSMYWFVPLVQDGSITQTDALVCRFADISHDLVPVTRSDDRGNRYYGLVGRWISRSFYTQARMLDAPMVRWTPDMNRLASMTDVLHPASKVFHLESEPYHGPSRPADPMTDPITTIAADGSGRRIARIDANRGVAVDPGWPWQPLEGPIELQQIMSSMEYTRSGVQGRDY